MGDLLRATQVGVEALVRRSPVSRTTQVGVEVLRSSEEAIVTSARTTQVGVEVLRTVALYVPPNARTTQAGVEVLRSSTTVTTSRTTQAGVDVLFRRPAVPKIAQVGVEVLRSSLFVIPPQRNHVTQVGVEVLYRRDFGAHATQVGVEVLLRRDPFVRLTQAGVEVLRSRSVVYVSPPVLAHTQDPDVPGLRTVLHDGVSGRFPFHHVETAEGDLVMANGVDPTLIWRQGKARAQKLGVPAPRSSPTVAVQAPHIFTPGTDTIEGGDVVNADGTIRRLTGYRVVSGVTFQPVSSASAPATAPALAAFIPTQADGIPFAKTGVRLSHSKQDDFAVNIAQNLLRETIRNRFLFPSGSRPDYDPILFTDWISGASGAQPFGLENQLTIQYDPICVYTEAQVARVVATARDAFAASLAVVAPLPGDIQQATDLIHDGGPYVAARDAAYRLLASICEGTDTGGDGAVAAPTPSTQEPIYQVVGFDDDLLNRTIHGRLFAAVRFLDADGHVSDFSPLVEMDLSLDRDSFDVVPRGDGTYTIGQIADAIRYTAVPRSSDPRVVRRQILRSLDGSANTFYVDVDTYDISSDTFVSGRPDADLIANSESVPLFDADGNPVANSHGEPPAHRRALAAHLGRLFLAGGVSDRLGAVSVVSGSRTVTGIGTDWKETYLGRALRVSGSPGLGLVALVDVSSQVIALEEPYAGPTLSNVPYSIDPSDGERRTIYWSEAGDAWGWPATNAFSVTETGDEIVGLFVMNSFLYIVETRHLHRATGQDNPAKDLDVFPGPERGCVNQRCIIRDEGKAYMLDEQGVYALTGAEEIEDLSAPIEDLFNGSNPSLAIDWATDRTLWFGVHDPLRGILRWFLALRGVADDSSALCYHLTSRAWWIETYDRDVLSGATGVLGAVRAIVGLDSREVGALDQRAVAAPSRSPGSILAVVSSTPLSVTLESSDAPAAHRITIAEGRGRGQVRNVVGTDASGVLLLATPWLVSPDGTSVAQVDGIPWAWHTGWMRLAPAQTSSRRDIEIVHAVLADPGVARMALSFNHAAEARVWRQDYERDGIRITEGEAEIDLDLGRADGAILVQIEGHTNPGTSGDRYLQVKMTGVAGQEPVTIYEVTINGVEEG